MRNTKNMLGLAIAVATLAGMAGVGQAAVITSISATAPTDNIAISQTTSDNERNWFNTSANGLRDIGQTFTSATSFTLDKVSMEISQVVDPTATPNAAFKFELFKFSSNTATSPTPSTAIFTENGTLPGTLAGGDWLTFDPTNVALSAGQTYGYRLEFPNEGPNLKFTIRTDSTYSGGRALEYNGAWETKDIGWDYKFYIQSAVPEPASGALVLLGLGALAMLPRRKRKAC